MLSHANAILRLRAAIPNENTVLIAYQPSIQNSGLSAYHAISSRVPFHQHLSRTMEVPKPV
jgi:hypothetical protein